MLRIRRGVSLLAAATAAIAVAPSLATAGTITVTPGSTYVSPQVTFAAQGESNDLVVGSDWDIEGIDDPPDGPSVYIVAAPGAVIQDRRNAITGGCLALRPQVRFCRDFGLSLNPSRRANAYTFQLGNGDDRILLVDSFLGGVHVDGGTGNDVISSGESGADSIICGAGVDVVFAEANDHVAPDCEIVNPPDSWLVDITVNVGGQKRHVRALRCDQYKLVRQYATTLVPCPLVVIGS